ncbi:MAG TPA: SET domain-containing protein [Gammaproteobacteria bacterium]|nr:SET domain-containing protein [Gammaproteobacteria bacterium]
MSNTFTTLDGYYDATEIANVAALINHGVPNAVVGYDIEKHKPILTCLTDIEAGTEITWNYGPGYVMNVLEFFEYDLLKDKCDELYETLITDSPLKGFLYQPERLGQQTKSQKKASTGMSAQISLILPVSVNASLLLYVFTRPMVLLQLKAQGYPHNKLKTLWDYMMKSDEVVGYVENLLWVPMMISMNMMQVDDKGFFSLIVNKLKDASRDAFEEVKWTAVVNIYLSNGKRGLPESDFFLSAKLMAESVLRPRDDGSLDVLNEGSYGDFFYFLEPKDQALLFKSLETSCPLLLNSMVKQSIKPKHVDSMIINKIKYYLPENLFDSLCTMIDNKTIPSFYKLLKKPVSGHNFRLAVSVNQQQKESILSKSQSVFFKEVEDKKTGQSTGKFKVYFS